MLVAGAVRAEHGRKQPARLIARFDNHRPGSVAEEDAGRAIRVVDEASKGIGADDEHALVESVLDELVAGRQRVDKSRTSRAEIEGAGITAEFGLHEAGLRDEKFIRGAGANNDQVDVRGFEPARSSAWRAAAARATSWNRRGQPRGAL